MDLNYNIIFAIVSVLDLYSISKLLNVFLGNRIGSVKYRQASYFIFYLVTTFAHFVVKVPIVMTIISFGSLIFLTLSYRGSIWKRILSVVFIYTILGVVEIIVVLISGYQSLSLFEHGEFSSIGGIVIIKILTYVLSLVLDKSKSIRSGKDVPISYWFCLFFIPFSSIFILYQSLNFEILTYNMLTVECVLFLVINLSVFYLYDRLAEKVTENAEHQMRLKEQEGYLRQYELMKTSIESMKGLKHDLRNHFMTLQSLAKDGSTQEINKYLKKMESFTEIQKSYIDTGNEILDSVLNYKIFEAEKKGIEIIPDVVFPSNLKLDAYDLTVVLGNLLDNAIESSANKKVQVSVRYAKGCMMIKVANDFAGDLHYGSDGKLKTRKAELAQHGLGLKNIDRVVEKYNGTMELQVKDQNFAAILLLYIE